MSDVLLNVRSVTQQFGHGARTFKALDTVDLTVRRGETVGLVGESGCGKSTLARAILLMRKPSSGAIEFDGNNVTGLRGAALRQHRRRVQMVFQDPNDSLDPRFTVGRSIAEPLAAAGIAGSERRRRVLEAIDQVGLPRESAGRYSHELSGGQRQRVAIARAMAVRPEFVVLDEPTSALDVSVQAQVLALLDDLQRRTGLSMVFISHDLAVIRAMSDEIAVMREGRVVESGPAADVLGAPQHPFTVELLASTGR